jgi:hypothetical protein
MIRWHSASPTAVQGRGALLSLSVEDFWQADEHGFTILRPVKRLMALITFWRWAALQPFSSEHEE